MKYDYLIIGGGIAGLSAAETIRGKDSISSIAIVGEEPVLPYSRVLLPYYLKGKIEREKIFLRKSEDFTSKRIDLFLGRRGFSVKTDTQEVVLGDGVRLVYKKLIIATGGRVKRLEVKGAKKENIFYLQTIDDADKIPEILKKIKKAVVVGGGFIALEFLEIFFTAGISTTLICRDENIFGKAVDREGSGIFKKNFLKHGIDFIFGQEVKEILGNESVEGVVLGNGKNLECDAIGVGIGLERNLDFLAGSDIAVNRGVLTDVFFESSKKGVFACGDIAEYFDPILGRKRLVGNWTNAFLQGRTAGKNALGQSEEFRQVSSYAITNLGFNITFLGETQDFDKSRVVARESKYERIFFKNDAVVGAVLINAPEEKQKIIKLVESKSVVAGFDYL